MGFLMEKVEGRPARPKGLARCEALLWRLHGLGDLGLVHEYLNWYSFVLQDDSHGVNPLLVDFEHAEGLRRGACAG